VSSDGLAAQYHFYFDRTGLARKSRPVRDTGNSYKHAANFLRAKACWQLSRIPASLMGYST